MILILLGLGDHGLKAPPNVENYATYSHCDKLPGMLYSLGSFKCVFATGNDQENDLSETRTLG